MPDDDDRPLDASSAADPGWPNPADRDPALDEAEWSHLVAPDDIRSLAADIAAYRREVWRARRAAQLRRLLTRPGIASLSLVVAGLAVAALVASLISAMEPDRAAKGPAALPLAHPTASVGEPHGLLPDVSLQSATGTSVSSRSLRPSVLALIPLHCDCVPLLSRLADQASTQTLPLVVVAPTVADAEASALPGQLKHGTLKVFYDSSDELATDVGAQGVTVVVLDRDGTVYDVRRAVPAQSTLELSGELRTMLASDPQATG